MILNGYTLETHVLTTFEPMLPKQPHSALIQKTPLTFHEEREFPYTTLCFEIEYGRVINPVRSYKSGHCEFSIVNSSQIFVSRPFTNPLFHLSSSCP